MTRSLLVVDDEKLVRWSIQTFMEKQDFRVVSSADGDDAVKKIENEKFDVIITDLVLPGVNGLEIARRVREIHPDTKIIMMTAYQSLLDMQEAEKIGVRSFINKPFQVSEVKAIVSRLISKT